MIHLLSGPIAYFQEGTSPREDMNKNIITIGRRSKHLVRRYLDPKNLPKRPSQYAFGSLGL